MSLLQEIEKFGLADCEFNRQLIRNETRINRLISIYLPAFNEQQIIEDDYDLVLTHEQAKKSGHFMGWLKWGGIYNGDRRNELYNLMGGLND